MAYDLREPRVLTPDGDESEVEFPISETNRQSSGA